MSQLQIQVPTHVMVSLRLLGLWDLFVSGVQNAKSMGEMTSIVEGTKDQAKKNYKQLARKWHPDLGGSAHAMQWLNCAVEQVNKINVQMPRPRPQVQVIYHNFYSGTSGYGNTSSTTSTTSSYGGFANPVWSDDED